MSTGRPTKLTAEVQEQIVTAVQNGAYLETAAAYAGVSKQALFKWLKRGREQKRGLYRNFVDAVEKAMADAELRDLALISRAAAGVPIKKTKTIKRANGTIETTVEESTQVSWQAAAWRLERRFPDRYGRRYAKQDNETENDEPKPPKIIGFGEPRDDKGGES